MNHVNIFLLTMIFSASLIFGEEKARLTLVVGKVEIRIAESPVWRDAKIGMPVSERNELRTFIESETEVTFGNGTKLKIGENSVVSIAKLQSDSATGTSKSAIKVQTGAIWANVKKITDGKSEFDFETPTAVASIRGTRLGIMVDKKNTLLDVYEGLVSVKKRGEKRAVNVGANTRAIIDKDKKEIAVIDFKEVVKSEKGKMVAPMDPYAKDTINAVVKNDTAVVEETGKVLSDSTGSIKQPDTSNSVPEEMLNQEGTKDSLMQTGSVSQEPEMEDTYIDAEVSGVPDGTTGVSRKLTLSVNSPADGAIITEPLIVVTGTTLPDASVFINDQQVPVGRDGAFMSRVPLPDEPYTYSLDIRTEYEGQQLSRQRKVVYAPKMEALTLECTSPQDGAEITGKTIRLSGKTTFGAQVVANGVPVSVTSAGFFTREFPVTEKDIGDYTLEVVTRNNNDELTKTISLSISGSSPQINTSMPTTISSFAGHLAVTQNVMTIQVLDRTPQEEIEISSVNNGMMDVITTTPGKIEKLLLDAGKNSYSIAVSDKAGNNAPTIKGEIYYLPGPMTLMLNEPSSVNTVIEGLPPVMYPGHKASEEPIDVEVEIDDGIGNVPESIRYCKVIGSKGTVLLRNKNNYIFEGKVPVLRGSNNFTVQAEDYTGRLETLKFVVIVK